MKIRKITMEFQDSKIISIPESGEFKDGINLIWSSSNNAGKTTLIRGIIKLLFSTSVTLPHPKNQIGQIKKIQLDAELNFPNSLKRRVTIYKPDIDKDEILLKEKNEIQVFDSQKEMFENIFEIQVPDIFRLSWIADRFLMDQDFGPRSPKLFPSHYNSDSKTLKAMDYWISTKRFKDNTEVIKLQEEIKNLKIEIKILEKQIETIKSLDKSDITGDYIYDEKMMDDLKKQHSELLHDINKINNAISEQNAQLHKIHSLSTKANKGANNFEKMYFIGQDVSNGEKIEVLSSLTDLMNWTKKPLKTVRSEYNNTKKEIEARLEKLKFKLKNKKDNRQKIWGQIQKTHPKILEGDINEFLSKYKEKEKEIKDKQDHLNSLNQEFQEYNKEIMKFTRKTSDYSEVVFKDFSSEDSKSGSDLFVRKFSEYFAFISEAKKIHIPWLIDSAKDSDLDADKFNILTKKMFALSSANKNQCILTATLDKKDIENNKFLKDCAFQIKVID